MKPKVFIASWVHMHNIPDEHRAANGSSQFFIVCRTTTKKRLAYILGTTPRCLSHYGAHITKFPQHMERAGEIDEVRYEVREAKSGVRGWFTWQRPDYLNKRDPL